MIEIRENDLCVYSRHGKNVDLCDVKYIFAVSDIELDELKIIAAERSTCEDTLCES